MKVNVIIHKKAFSSVTGTYMQINISYHYDYYCYSGRKGNMNDDLGEICQSRFSLINSAQFSDFRLGTTPTQGPGSTVTAGSQYLAYLIIVQAKTSGSSVNRSATDNVPESSG